VNQVLLNLQPPVAAKVTSDSSWCSNGRVGGSGERAEALDYSVALEANRHDCARKHELNKWLIERLADVLSVVLFEQFARSVDAL
jgi:hypothetical protein